MWRVRMSVSLRSAVRKKSERALRFALALPLYYRSKGQTEWREARIENISRSGVLFRTDDVMDVNTRLEMRFELTAGPALSGVLCRGHVVRTVLPRDTGSLPGFAATISAYRFIRPRAVA
jgi:hypothetical protein